MSTRPRLPGIVLCTRWRRLDATTWYAFCSMRAQTRLRAAIMERRQRTTRASAAIRQWRRCWINSLFVGDQAAGLHRVELSEHVFHPGIVGTVADLRPFPLSFGVEHPILRDGVTVEQIDDVRVGGDDGKGVALLLHKWLDQAEVFVDVEGKDLDVGAAFRLHVEFL